MERLIGPQTLRLIDMALEEDAGRGDVTTRCVVPSGAIGKGRVVAKAELVVAGLAVFEASMHHVDPWIRISRRVDDGERLARGDIAADVEGPLASMLTAERTALNFLQHLSGVATLTRRMVDALPAGSRTVIADTRKTTPGMRALERAAVLVGGGRNHRPDLAGGVLIKENHIAAAGGIEAAIERCRAGAPHTLRIEIEVRSEMELERALAAGAEVVLLDNMNAEEIRRCVGIAAGRAVVEVSGGVTVDNVAELALPGVDVISVGALTHSAPAADLSFLLEGA